ncbi:S8 family serine peptidase [Pseudomonas wadenswilerensis]
MNKQLVILRQVVFDGDIHLELQGYDERDVTSTRYTLFVDGIASATQHGQGLLAATRFRGVIAGENTECHALASIGLNDGTVEEQVSQPVKLFNAELPESWRRKTPDRPERVEKYVTTQANFHPCKGAAGYFIEVLFKKGGASRFLSEQALPVYRKNAAALSLVKTYSDEEVRKHDVGPFSELHRIKGDVPVETMIAITEEIGQLEYVTYAVVTPDLTNYPPPEALVVEDDTTDFDWRVDSSSTPDFNHHQTYLDEAFPGLNVRNAWPRAEGLHATVRWLDFGIYRKHEALWHSAKVVTSRPETQDCHHGTASTGVIVASDITGGMKGIARFSHFFFYDTGSMDLIVRDARAGDVIGLDIQLVWDERLLPVTVQYDWWSKIRFLTQEKKALVCLAAGNGGLDLDALIEQGIIEDHGYCGGYLVGACSSSNGNRLYFSNYGQDTLFNGWGENVATTGYGSLFYPDKDNNRSYTRTYNGTSSATPVVAGALALMQGFGRYRYGLNLAEYVPWIVIDTGDGQGAAQGIGYRPLVLQAIDSIEKAFGK